MKSGAMDVAVHGVDPIEGNAGANANYTDDIPRTKL